MKLRVAVFLLTLFILAVCASLPAASGASAVRSPLKFSLLVDRSGSSCPAQLETWRKPVEHVLRGLRPGDLVQVLSIDDKSDGSAPLFREVFPVRPAVSGRKADAAYRNSFTDFQRRLAEALRRVFSPGTEKVMATDVFSTLRKVGPEGAMEAVTLYASDMLHVGVLPKSGHRLNFESMNLKAMNTRQWIPDLVREYGWSPKTLEGARVFVLLNNGAICPAVTKNRVMDIEAVYEPLIRALGGRLVSFDTVLKGGIL